MSHSEELYWSSKEGKLVDYWQTLADEYGYPVAVIHMLYDDWNTQEYANFGDYIRARQAEVIAST